MKEIATKETPTQMVKSTLPLIWLVIALLALRWTIVEPYEVPTGSMEPTLKPGDRLYALKCAYDVRLPFTDQVLFKIKPVKRGDVILFRSPENPDVTFVKRAVAIPGDHIAVHGGRLYVNGKEVAASEANATERKIMSDLDYPEEKKLYVEDLTGVKHWMILHDQMPHLREFPEIGDNEGVMVPSDAVFAVGDNRDNSHDSRAWGFVPMQNMKGRAMFIWFSGNDKSITDLPYGSMVAQLGSSVVNFFRAIADLPSGAAYVRPERIGTLIQ